MPELPEVETFRRQFSQGKERLVGRTIRSADVLWERSLAEPDRQAFLGRITGQPILSIGRRGKYLLFQLPVDMLLIHLRMSGDLRLELADVPMDRHYRLLLQFTDGTRLAFVDPRKFGRVWLTQTPQQVLGGLGPEPLDPVLTDQELYERLQARRRLLKPLLLDQSFLAGLGNIYTDEALHLARLHPLTLSDGVSFQQSAVLLESIRSVLEEGIRRNGASIDWVYRGGEFQNYFRAYGRTGQPCPVCGTLIERIVVGQRGTHFCPVCQR